MYRDSDTVPEHVCDVAVIVKKHICSTLNNLEILRDNEYKSTVTLQYTQEDYVRHIKIECRDHLVRAAGCKTYEFKTVGELKKAILYLLNEIIQC